MKTTKLSTNAALELSTDEASINLSTDQELKSKKDMSFLTQSHGFLGISARHGSQKW